MRNVLMSFGAIALLATLTVQAQGTQSQLDPKQTVTVSGCVKNETDVLKRPAAGVNVGMGDEFVLTQATLQTGAPATQPPSPTEPAANPPAGTSGADVGKVYRLTGAQEAALKAHLGHKVEITGSFKSEDDARAELGAIGTSGKRPATPAEPTVTNTPEITINAIKMIAETCGG